MQEIKLHGKYTFTPHYFMPEISAAMPPQQRKAALERGAPKYAKVTGIIIHVNEAHRHFTVEYPMGRQKLRETIKF